MFQNVYFLIAVHSSFPMQYVTWKVWNENSKQILKTHKFCKCVRSIWFPTVILLSCLFLAVPLAFPFGCSSQVYFTVPPTGKTGCLLTWNELLRALLCQYVLYSLLKMTKQIRSMLLLRVLQNLMVLAIADIAHTSIFSTDRELLGAVATSANYLKRYWVLSSGDHEAKQNA